MPDRFKVEIFGQITDPAPTVWITPGDSIDIGGIQHVRLSHGTIMPVDDRWVTTEADANRHAAELLDQCASRIKAKAAAIRTEVDATANPVGSQSAAIGGLLASSDSDAPVQDLLLAVADAVQDFSAEVGEDPGDAPALIRQVVAQLREEAARHT